MEGFREKLIFFGGFSAFVNQFCEICLGEHVFVHLVHLSVDCITHSFLLPTRAINHCINMTLEERIAQDLKAAMKAKDQAALRSIRAVKSAILLFKTDGSGKELDEASGIKLLQKLVKQRKDSLDIYEKQGREDLAQKEREEISVIERYLPEQISPEKLEGIIRTIIEQTGANSMKDMGKVMGMASKQLAGKADGKTISGVVKQLLSQG